MRSRPLALLCLVLGFSGCSTLPEAEVSGKLQDRDISEASGLAASHTMPGVYWSHNDSGGEPVLYGLTADGKPAGRIRVTGVSNVDWEDVSSFDLNGLPYLVIGEVGDNNGVRKECRLIVIAEPPAGSVNASKEVEVAPAWIVPVHYPDGATDCESVAVDPKEGFFYLLVKRKNPPVLYRLPLHPSGDLSHLVAERVGVSTHIPQASSLARMFPAPRLRYDGEPTAMDFSSDGRRALVLTYRKLIVFQRNPGESWANALAGEPLAVLPHDLPQAEGACFSRDGHFAFAVSEGLHEPIIRWNLERLGQP